MLDYAFIANSEGLNPGDYHWEYENDEMRFRFCSTHDMETNKKLAKELAASGCQYLDLCGDFNAAMAREIAEAAGGRLTVEYSKFSAEDDAKFNSLTNIHEYGLIIMAEGLANGKIITHKLVSDEFTTTIALVSNDETAKQAAQDLVNGGIDFIEMCSYFDAAKADEVRAAIGGKVPVGYCG